MVEPVIKKRNGVPLNHNVAGTEDSLEDRLYLVIVFELLSDSLISKS